MSEQLKTQQNPTQNDLFIKKKYIGDFSVIICAKKLSIKAWQELSKKFTLRDNKFYIDEMAGIISIVNSLKDESKPDEASNQTNETELKFKIASLEFRAPFGAIKEMHIKDSDSEWQKISADLFISLELRTFA